MSRNNPRRVVYIVGFRLRRFCRGEVYNKRIHEAKYGPYHAGRLLDCVMDPLLHVVVFHADFFFSRSSILEKLT
jgi:hypothetical protein